MFPIARKLLVLGGVTLLVGLLATESARAHVKWFADYDLTKPPLPIGEVLTRPFVTLFLAWAYRSEKWSSTTSMDCR